jgi:hypothetical protein
VLPGSAKQGRQGDIGMRIGFSSYHPLSTATDSETYDDFQLLCHAAVALKQQGVQIHWLSSTDTAEALAHDPRLVVTEAQSVPETCRYVVPYQAYRFADIPLMCIDSALWQRSELHTRLFTLLCLLQRAHPCSMMYVWGTLPVIYLTVYTACFLGVPVVVSSTPPGLPEAPQQAFLWRWVVHHASLVLVRTEAQQQSLLTTHDVPAHRVRVVDPTLSTLGATLASLYESLKV